MWLEKYRLWYLIIIIVILFSISVYIFVHAYGSLFLEIYIYLKKKRKMCSQSLVLTVSRIGHCGHHARFHLYSLHFVNSHEQTRSVCRGDPRAEDRNVADGAGGSGQERRQNESAHHSHRLIVHADVGPHIPLLRPCRRGAAYRGDRRVAGLVRVGARRAAARPGENNRPPREPPPLRNHRGPGLAPGLFSSLLFPSALRPPPSALRPSS